MVLHTKFAFKKYTVLGTTAITAQKSVKIHKI